MFIQLYHKQNTSGSKDAKLELSYGLVSQLTVLQGTLRIKAGTKWEQTGERSWAVPLHAEWRMR